MRGGPATRMAAAAALATAGCGEPPEPRLGEGRDAPGGAPVAGRTPEERVVREWSRAVNLGEYERAAKLFERGAIVEQLAAIRLDTRRDAIAFNRSLPCRADVTDVRQDADSTLAAFSLRQGRTGDCDAGGRARVRFVIREGKIREWRQLPTPPTPSGEVARTAVRVG